MNEKFYYLHVWAVEGLITNPLTGNSLIDDNAELEINHWPKDDLFCMSPFFFCTERLRSMIEYKKLSGVVFCKIDKVTKGANFSSNHPNSDLPPYYWWMVINGNIYLDDFSLWGGKHLVVSNNALDLLRDNHVTHAEHEELDVSAEEYFSSKRHFFWMPEQMRQRFLQMT